jgi:hypothetical protein
MTATGLLQIAFGFVFLYTLLSLVCSVANEWIARWLDLRESTLRKELARLLPAELLKEFDEHPLIGISGHGAKYSDYLPPSTFALALIDVAVKFTPGAPGYPGQCQPGGGLEHDSKKLVESLIQHAGSLDAVQTRIEKWFTLAMEDATGRFKRATQVIITTFALLLTVALNVDAGAIAIALWKAAQGQELTVFPIFWSAAPTISQLLSGVPGYLTSAACISLGAPFWFDLLGKLVNLRQTGLPPNQNRQSNDMMAH